MKILDRLAALNASTLPHREWSVATVLARYADDDTGECWPSVRTIASSSKMGERTVREAIGELERLGIIELVRRSQGRSSHRFRLRLDLLSPSPNPADAAGLEADQPGSGCRVEPGDSRRVGIATRQMPPGNPADGAPQPCGSRSATTKQQTREHHHQRRHAPASNGATPQAVDAGGGDSLSGAGGFVGDLAEAAERLTALGVNGAKALAQRAGSDRAVEWIIERAHAAGVRDRAALAAKLIGDGERPPASWKPRHERTRAPANPWERDAETRRQDLAQKQAEEDAAQALIARHREIADRAAASLAEGDGIDARTLRRKPRHLWAQHPVARSVVLAAIERETGERPRPAARGNGHAKQPQETTR